VAIDWQGFHQANVHNKVSLPTYPFQRSRFWVDGIRQTTVVKKPKEQISSSLLDLLHLGKSDEVIQRITDTGGVSKDKLTYLPEILNLILQEKKRKQGEESLGIYKIQWRNEIRSLQPVADRQSKHFTWIIFKGSDGDITHIEKYISERGDNYFTVFPRKEFETTGLAEDGRSTSSPFDEAALQSLLSSCAAETRSVQILFAWGFNVQQIEPLSIEALTKKKNQLSYGLLNLARQVSKLDSKIKLKVWIVTSHAVPVEDPDPVQNLCASVLWGMGKSLALEIPDRWGGMVDVDAQSVEHSVEELMNEIIYPTRGEMQVVYRKAQRYVSRLDYVENFKQEPIAIHPDKTYLITGGLGNLGLQTANWLVSAGARHLVLLGRNNNISESVRAQLDKLKLVGANIEIKAADVCKRVEMEYVFNSIDKRYSLAGVIHAAGVTDFKLLNTLQSEDMSKVMSSKVEGSWILHQLTENLKLDFFIGYSSIASVWGSKGQAHYAAGNEFLDNLCSYRRHRNLPGLSINWGLWKSENGFGEDLLKQTGVFTMDQEAVWKLMPALCQHHSSQIIVSRIDWHILKPLLASVGVSNFFERINIKITKGSDKKTEVSGNYFEDLSKTPVKKRKALLLSQVRNEVGIVLRLDASLIDKDKGLFEMGFDSLMALELKGRLERKLNCSLPSTVGFDFPTIAHLTNHIAEILSLDFSVEPKAVKEQNEEKINNTTMEDLSVSELEKLLEDELNKN
jgi:acyl transferase domain-containing protein/acyl carrier protein